MIKEKCCGCVIIENNKILLVHQQNGAWSFPKGHVEENETEKETAIREVKEETNLEVKIKNNKKYIEKYTLENGNEKEVIYFLAEIIKGEIKPQEEEIYSIEWVTFDEAFQIIGYENRRELLKEILNDIMKNNK